MSFDGSLGFAATFQPAAAAPSRASCVPSRFMEMSSRSVLAILKSGAAGPAARREKQEMRKSIFRDSACAPDQGRARNPRGLRPGARSPCEWPEVPSVTRT